MVSLAVLRAHPRWSAGLRAAIGGGGLVALAAGCSVQVVEPFYEIAGPGAGGAAGGAGGSAGRAVDAGTDAQGGSTALPDSATPGHLRGTVRAPNGTLPIAGALLYLTKDRPEPASDKVFCDGCVTLPAAAPHTLSDAAGHFELVPATAGTQFLVLQKGGFRRVKEITIGMSSETLAEALTTLPPKTDLEQGDEVPRMTVVQGQYDEVETSLHKLGIDPSAIDLVGSALVGQAAGEFLRDPARVNGRHIVFLPCGDLTQPAPNLDLSVDPQVQDNLRGFVEAGGRLYVTDWHYDFIARTFPGYLTWHDQSALACSGCLHLPYNALAQVTDGGLGAWLAEQSLSSFTLQNNYTTIDAVSAVETTDSGGAPLTVTPRVWVKGKPDASDSKPATVSFEAGCGRVLFSTYHTEPFSTELTPQERALLGVLLEVSVCNDSSSGVIIK